MQTLFENLDNDNQTNIGHRLGMTELMEQLTSLERDFNMMLDEF